MDESRPMLDGMPDSPWSDAAARVPSAPESGGPIGAASGARAPREAQADWLRALEEMSRIGSDPSRILPRVLAEAGAAFGDAPALLGEPESLTHGELARRINMYARWALDAGLAGGGIVALLMPNRPDYLAIWLGVTRVGGVVALLNTNLKGAQLAHCIALAAPRHLIVDAELIDAFDGARPHLAAAPEPWLFGEAGRDHPRLDEVAAAYPGDPLRPDEEQDVTLSDRALLIYTSGTTGLPKAAHVSHHRLMAWSGWFRGLLDMQAADRMYDCLPLYHSVGGIVAPGSVLLAGGSVVIRRRFSAGRFWDDVATSGCTLFQYIGELCRYLVNAPAGRSERAHRLRAAAGNGLRPDVWEAFADRFAIPRILEFYAATEGTVSLYNVEGKVGAVGRVPPFLAHRFPALIVRHDVEAGVPLRDAQGRCVRAARGEAGELLGRLSGDPRQPAQRFEGYTDAGASDDKVLRDVLVPGDAWMRTGDLMRQDAAGFFHFVDRAGDTFRWKGENVATGEVAEALCAIAGIEQAIVYGVRVPGTEGRAGMAALKVGPGFALEGLHAEIERSLPRYARPLFLRLVGEIDSTETFKPRKAALMDEGFDPARIRDPLYVEDAPAGVYRRLDADLFAAIGAGELRL